MKKTNQEIDKDFVTHYLKVAKVRRVQSKLTSGVAPRDSFVTQENGKITLNISPLITQHSYLKLSEKKDKSSKIDIPVFKHYRKLLVSK